MESLQAGIRPFEQVRVIVGPLLTELLNFFLGPGYLPLDAFQL
jgi:hypothetical protein